MLLLKSQGARERDIVQRCNETASRGRGRPWRSMYSQGAGSQVPFQWRRVDLPILWGDLIKNQSTPAFMQPSGNMDHQHPIVACQGRGRFLRNGSTHSKGFCSVLLSGKKFICCSSFQPGRFIGRGLNSLSVLLGLLRPGKVALSSLL